MIIRQRMSHHSTTLYLTNLKNNLIKNDHIPMRLADYGCFLKWLRFGTGLILLFFGIFNGSPSDSASNFIRDSVLISNFLNFDYGRSLQASQLSMGLISQTCENFIFYWKTGRMKLNRNFLKRNCGNVLTWL